MEKRDRKSKKLTLSKETLQRLERRELGKVAGALPTVVYTCANTCFRSCKTCPC